MELDLIFHNFLPQENIMVHIDAYKMGQVLRNLISNALKFSKGGGKVIVKIEYPPDDPQPHASSSPVEIATKTSLSNLFSPFGSSTRGDSNKIQTQFIRISVQDSGAGITLENQNKLFNEIVQFDAAKLQQGKGSGIGLWSKFFLIKALFLS
jgi:signal transduction histidine kinase